MLSGPYFSIRAACHPCSGVHSTESMWSVKYVPNPGLARISATSASLRGESEGVVVMSSVMRARYLSRIRWLRSERSERLETTPGGSGWRWVLLASLADARTQVGRAVPVQAWKGSGALTCVRASTSCGAPEAWSARNAGGDRVADLRGRAAGTVDAGRQVGDDRLLDATRRLVEAEVLEHQGRQEDRGRGVGLLLPGDVGGRAVDRLEHRRCGAVGIDVAARRQA